MKLIEKHIFDLRNLRRKYNLKETRSKDDDATLIKCENYEDIIDAIHYLLSVLQKDLLINDIEIDIKIWFN
jgi:hypothetical protein